MVRSRAGVFGGSRFNGINFNTTKKKSRGSPGSSGITARLGIFLVLFFFFVHTPSEEKPPGNTLRVSPSVPIYIYTCTRQSRCTDFMPPILSVVPRSLLEKSYKFALARNSRVPRVIRLDEKTVAARLPYLAACGSRKIH